MGWLLGSGGKVKHVCLLSSNPSMFIRTVSSKRLLSTLQNQIELVYGRVWAEQHAQYTETSDPDQPGRKPM